jgi:pre-mRNA-splicing factor CWC22
MSLPVLKNKLMDPELKDYLIGLFPVDHPKNTRFSINFFTSIG